MATRFSLSRLGGGSNRSMFSFRGTTSRYFSDSKGRVLSEEELAAENVYIQKMERERLEKQKQKADKEKAEKLKASTEKKTEESHNG